MNCIDHVAGKHMATPQSHHAVDGRDKAWEPQITRIKRWGTWGFGFTMLMVDLGSVLHKNSSTKQQQQQGQNQRQKQEPQIENCSVPMVVDITPGSPASKVLSLGSIVLAIDGVGHLTQASLVQLGSRHAEGISITFTPNTNPFLGKLVRVYRSSTLTLKQEQEQEQEEQEEQEEEQQKEQQQQQHTL